MQANNLLLGDIKIGDSTSFLRSFTEEDILLFSKLSGDENPLHMDETYAKNTSFGQRVVHGMLVASLCSRLVGMNLPGKRCLYLGQTLNFRNPVFLDDVLSVSGTVTFKSESTSIIKINISIKKETLIVLDGEATVQLI